MKDIKGNVLIIDDDPRLAQLVERALGTIGLTVMAVHSAPSLQKLLSQPGPPAIDLILLDLVMPDADGVYVFQQLKNHPVLAQAPVIIVSGIDNLDKRLELLSMGADDYIGKPFAVNELVMRATIQIELSRLRRAKQQADQQLAWRERQIKAISEIGSRATHSLQLETMLNDVVDEVRHWFDCDQCAIYLTEPDGQQLTLRALAPAGSHPPLEQLPYELACQGKVIPQDAGIMLPLLREDEECLGLLFIRCQDSQHDRGALDALHILSSQLTTAVANSYLFRDVEQHNQALENVLLEHERLLQREQVQRQHAETLFELAGMVTSSLDIDLVVASAMDSLRMAIGVEEGSLFLLNEKTNKLSFAGLIDDSLAYLRDVQLDADKGIVGLTVQNGVSLCINDAQNHPDFSLAIDLITGRITHSILCAPLIAKGRILGAVELFNKSDGDFTDEDVRFVNSAANTIAVALDNSRLYRELSNLVEELQRSQEQLLHSEKLAATGRLAASLAHEINNPLQAIHSAIQLALKFDLAPETRAEYLQMTNEEIERLIGMVTHILDFARPSPKAVEPADINQILEQVLKLASKHVRNGEYTIRQRLAPDLPEVAVITDQIAQVFLNLLLNALDAIPNVGTVTIVSQLTDEWVEISFTDTGIGIPQANLQRIFEPFFTTKPDGNGLGLAICYRIIEQHHGKMLVQSQVNKGTRFTVQLPLDRQKEPDILDGSFWDEFDLEAPAA
ncbi:MAG: GAF domain-containing protein [Anaerolineales bacterium]|nr:GAF domain-containing protein [Anaerolineales bacterium]